MPYNPKNQLSLAGGVPYNVVNGTGSKEQLITMAKVESNFQENRANKIKIGDSSPIAPGGGLAAHEAKGGHLLERHVGKTDEELVKRLEEQSYITGASTFYDRATAERLIQIVIIN